MADTSVQTPDDLIELETGILEPSSGDLKRQAMKTISEKKKAEALTAFSARMSRLEAVPADFESPAILKRLELEFNEIALVPASLSLLVNLEFLNLSRNHISSIEEGALEHLIQLKHLDLSANLLTSIPLALSTLTQLEFFSVSKNRLTHWPLAPIHWKALKSLSLSGHPTITETLPESFNHTAFPILTALDLGENDLKVIPSQIGTLTTLLTLDLAINSLTAWPDHLSTLTELRCIDLALNDLTEIPVNLTLESHPHLSEVNLMSNAIDIFHLPAPAPKFYRLGLYNTPSLIVPGLYLGNIESSYNKHRLSQLGVSHIVSIIENPIPYPYRFQYYHVALPDIESTNLLAHFDEACRFIDSAIVDSGRACLVHCHAGMSRSATMVIAWIMKTFLLCADDAESFVRDQRPIILPNSGFLQQLKLWENELRSRKLALQMPGSKPHKDHLTPWLSGHPKPSRSGSDSKCVIS